MWRPSVPVCRCASSTYSKPLRCFLDKSFFAYEVSWHGPLQQHKFTDSSKFFYWLDPSQRTLWDFPIFEVNPFTMSRCHLDDRLSGIRWCWVFKGHYRSFPTITENVSRPYKFYMNFKRQPYFYPNWKIYLAALCFFSSLANFARNKQNTLVNKLLTQRFLYCVKSVVFSSYSPNSKFDICKYLSSNIVVGKHKQFEKC